MALNTEREMDVQDRWVKSHPLRSKWSKNLADDFNWKKQGIYQQRDAGQDGTTALGRARLGAVSPPDTESLEWILLTSVPVQSVDDAWQRVCWYRCRWLVEDFQKVLKSGCRMETRRMHTVAALENLLAILTPLGCAYSACNNWLT